MSSITPPPDPAAYQRWEPTALDPVERVTLQMPTASDLEAIHQQAHEEGFEAGFREGFETGRNQAQAQVLEEVRRLQALLGEVSEAIAVYGQDVSGELMALALEISRQMLKQALKVKPELLLPVVRSAMETLPPGTAHPHLHLHPDDAVLVRSAMQVEAAQNGWKIIDDARVARGGCRIETPVSEIDATLPNRWQRLASALGQDHHWLDE